MNSRAKGMRAENELAARLRELGFHAARRESSMYRPGFSHADVVGIRGLHLEVKRCERLNIPEAMKQSIADAAITGEVPTVVHRRNREPWLMTVRLDDIFRLAEELSPLIRRA